MKKHIAIIGKSGSGKDYVTQKILTRLTLMGIQSRRFAFADAIKKQISIFLNLTDEQSTKIMHDEAFKNHTVIHLGTMCIVAESDVNHIHPIWKSDSLWTAADLSYRGYMLGLGYDDFYKKEIYMTMREFIVYYGTYLFQKYLGRKVWLYTVFNSKEYQNLEDNDGVAIITDTRFKHEYQECKDRGFVFLKVCENSQTKRAEKLDNIAESLTDTFEYDFKFENYKDDENKFEEEMNRLFEWLKS